LGAFFKLAKQVLLFERKLRQIISSEASILMS